MSFTELSETRELNADELEVITGGWLKALYGFFASEVADGTFSKDVKTAQNWIIQNW